MSVTDSDKRRARQARCRQASFFPQEQERKSVEVGDVSCRASQKCWVRRARDDEENVSPAVVRQRGVGQQKKGRRETRGHRRRSHRDDSGDWDNAMRPSRSRVALPFATHRPKRDRQELRETRQRSKVKGRESHGRPVCRPANRYSVEASADGCSKRGSGMEARRG
ncbi:hypothetical protein V8C26DRAFT_402472 [Trichoderma gracile]